MTGDFEDFYTGVLTRLSPIPRAPDDPEVFLWGGTVPPWGPRAHELAVGGAGWDEEGARAACIGEAVERMQAYALPCDAGIEASYEGWPLGEGAIDPDRWVLFHPDQYREPAFPFQRLTRRTSVRWVCFREATSGAPLWIPQDLGFLFHDSGPSICPATSTGLSSGEDGQPVLLRGLQEVVERDAAVGAWWGRYPLEEWDSREVLGTIGPTLPPRVVRPHRRYRFYRVRSPFSDHVTLVTTEGEDRGGYLFAAGSACRETLGESWRKALLEAIQGAAYVRQLRADGEGLGWVDDLGDFPHHAAYYSAHPERLSGTVLDHATARRERPGGEEGMATLQGRLGSDRPVLFRLMTPPAISQEFGGWRSVRVVVPGLQPLHGNHRWPHLGGPLWNRPVSDWDRMPPHPFA